MSTAMERAVVLRAARERNELPIQIENNHPDIAAVIHRCLSHNPDCRPSALELKTSSVLGGWSIEKELAVAQMDLANKDRVINSLQRLLQASGIEWRDMLMIEAAPSSYSEVTN
eukprot:c7247_g1_i1.p1 GENE.c7247_g1_i1~~c7247_g1_i1.p1  ORF type:complete len:114 (-),score=20.39 c7247_g1_i1:80-421(-)